MSAKFLYKTPTPFTDNKVELESNRPQPKVNNTNQWELFLVRRGHPLRQLAVNASIVTIQATLVHLTLITGQWVLLTYMALWAVFSVMCWLGVIGDSVLTRHMLLMFLLLVAGAIVGIV